MNHQLKIEPYAYQIEGMKRCVELKENFANFSDPGTGKTLMCIGAMNHLEGEIKRVLIICPNSLKYNWAKELGYSKIDWNVTVLEGSGDAKEETIRRLVRSGRGAEATRCVVITNYDSIKRLLPQLKLFSPDLIINDEMHQIKSHNTQRTKAIKKIPSKMRWGLTGTPYANTPLDIWSQVDWLKPGHLSKNFYAFRAKHCLMYTGAGFPIIRGYLKLDELKEQVGRISWKVTKDEALDLPDQTWTERQVTLSAAEARVYKDMAKEMVAEIGESEVIASTLLVKMLRLMQMTGGFVDIGGQVQQVGTSKIEVLREVLEELQGQKVVVFCHFRHEIKMITELLAKMKRPAYHLIADHHIMERQGQIEAFQACDTDAVMVVSVAVGGVGVTLTAASYAVYFSNDWSYVNRDQSEARLHRIGQANKVTYVDLVVPGSIDSYILRKLKGKQEMASKLTSRDLNNILFDKE